MYRHLLLTALLLILPGCSLLEPTPAADPATTTSLAPAGSAPPTAVVVEPDLADSPCLAGDRPFARDGVISAFGEADGDADQISMVRWAEHPGCERVVVDLLTADGAPARTINPVGVEYDSDLGVIRINLPTAISRSAIADSRFDGALVDRAYVVSTAEGHIAIDIHVARSTAISLRAYEISSPSRIVIDVKSEQEADPAVGAAVSPRTVLIRPLPGATSTSLSIEGYAKGSGDELSAIVVEGPDQAVVLEEAIPFDGTGGLWHEFTTEISDLPQTQLQLSVGFTGSEAATLDIDTTLAGIADPAEA